MSRIGNKNIVLPSAAKLEVSPERIKVTGPKGVMEAPNFQGIQIEIEDNIVKIRRSAEDAETRAKHGLVRALLANCIQGTTQGFSRTLILQGVGYRAAKKGSQLVLSLGYSHEVLFNTPEGVSIEVPEPTKVLISGIDKQKVGQAAANIRSFRQPEPYKGKGIRYDGEKIRRKAGKTGKK